MSRLPLSLTLIPLHLVINGPVDKCVHAFPSALCMGLNGISLRLIHSNFNTNKLFHNGLLLRLTSFP